MKKFLPVLFMLTFLLTACSGEQETQTAEALSTEVISQPTEVEPTEAEPTEITPTESTASESGGSASTAGVKMECTLVSDQPDAPAEYVAIFGVTEDDWVKGSETAAVTIVEYSDFQ